MANTEVSFYHLTAVPVDRALPKLLEKIYATGLRTRILLSSTERAQALDQWLWDYAPQEFLPHGMDSEPKASEYPIIISSDGDKNANNAQVVLMIGAVWAEDWQSYERCLLMFDGHNQEELEHARQKWQWCKQQDVPLTYWQQTAQGIWEKAASA